MTEETAMPGLQPHHVQEIHELIHAKQMLRAIKVYHDATGVSLAEAKRAVEEMALVESARPHATGFDNGNPVLEGKIQSLLAKGRKVEAVKIYREQNRVSLKDARDAVERIEAAMPRDPSIGMPYNAVIGSDPFTEADGGGRRMVILLAGLVALVICGLAVVILLLGM
jgi:ribosomal protein L7/L12